jgi:hypothetical protein
MHADAPEPALLPSLGDLALMGYSAALKCRRDEAIRPSAAIRHLSKPLIQIPWAVPPGPGFVPIRDQWYATLSTTIPGWRTALNNAGTIEVERIQITICFATPHHYLWKSIRLGLLLWF